jgi:HD-GYP domain-containing protein (c-di-GMP phosphodiesterase class II)
MSEEEKNKEHLLDRPLDRSRLKVDFNPAEHGLAPLSLQVLVPGQPAPVNLYLPLVNKKTKTIRMALAAEAGEIFRASWRDKLIKQGQSRIFVKVSDGTALTNYFDRFSEELIDNPQTSVKKKTLVVREIASLNLRLLFGSDLSPRALEGSVERAQNTVQQIVHNAQILTNLAEVLKADYSVYTHSVNVCMVAMAFGRYLGLTDDAVQSLGMAGLLHDLGMSKMPPVVLEKPGPLTDEEREAVQQHPKVAYKLLTPISAVPYEAMMAILHHHENADGTGYPEGLPARKTPYLARVLKICDAYDAMTSKRPYQAAKPAYDAASTLMESMGNQFGQDLVPSFIRFLASPFFSE